MYTKLKKLQPANKKLYFPSNLVNDQLRDFLNGRLWLRDHSPFPEETIQKHIQMGLIQTIPGIHTIPITNKLFSKNKYICNRCHNEKLEFFAHYNCAKCQQICVYCRHCINMGRVSSCSDLIKWSGPFRNGYFPFKTSLDLSRIFQWNGTFTPQQKKASEELIDSIQMNRSHLVHAVCGAGNEDGI